MEDIKVNPPTISEKTMQKMAEFFLQHTVPLILADQRIQQLANVQTVDNLLRKEVI